MSILEELQAEQFYLDAIYRVGEFCTYLVNVAGIFTETTAFKAVFKMYRQEELIGSVHQDDIKVFVLENDLSARGIIPKRGDKLRYRGLLYTIITADNATRSINANIIAYVLQVRG